MKKWDRVKIVQREQDHVVQGLYQGVWTDLGVYRTRSRAYNEMCAERDKDLEVVSMPTTSLELMAPAGDDHNE